MSLSAIILALIEINAIIVIVLLIREERDPSTTLAWAFALLLIPGLGLIAYLLFGTDHRILARRDPVRRQANSLGATALEPVYARFPDGLPSQAPGASTLSSRLSSAIERQCGTRPLPCENLEVFAAGEHKFERLVEDIAAARDSIHLQYFIWEEDDLTRRVCEALEERAAAGVTVRVTYDWMGSIAHRKHQLKRLAAAGAHVKTARPHPLWLNYLDHRKIAVIDGRIGYTGGMNMGREYVDGGNRFDSWRDTHCRFTGPLVAELQRMFASRWYRLTRESLFDQRHFPGLEVTGAAPVWGQLAYSGPGSEWPALRNAFLLAITGARDSLRIQSPYFIPDEAIMTSLKTQALAGVDLRFMMTGIPDKRGVWYAAFSYIDDLITAGGRMLHYRAGFFHAKTLTVDGEVAVIGTTNFDIRSFALHDELSLFFYDPAVARTLDATFEHDAEECIEIDQAFYDRMSVIARTRNALLRLSSKLL